MYDVCDLRDHDLSAFDPDLELLLINESAQIQATVEFLVVHFLHVQRVGGDIFRWQSEHLDKHEVLREQNSVNNQTGDLDLKTTAYKVKPN